MKPFKLFDNLRGRAAIHGTADHFGETPEDVRREIQACIDEAWDADDLAAMVLQRELFPDGKPTPEQFIATVARHIKEKNTFPK